MIIEDAKRILEFTSRSTFSTRRWLSWQTESEIACRLSTIPGFGKTSAAELAGEIGTLDRFASECQPRSVRGDGDAGRSSQASTHETKRLVR